MQSNESASMYLAIDIGNSRTKVAVYENNTALYIHFFTQEKFIAEVENILLQHPQIKKALLATVGKLSEQEMKWLQAHVEVAEVHALSKLPFKNHYATPTTLGADRALLVAGAALKYPATNCLIIDAGSCITYDFITKDAFYLGGAISPGFSLRYKSLNDYTAKLPLLHLTDHHPIIGNSTETSIQSGVINGILLEIEGFIAQYEKTYDTLTLILTGGDAIFLAKRLKYSIFAQPNFLLESLILHHQYICK